VAASQSVEAASSTVARVASEFQALERLRDAGYGGSVVAEKLKEIRLAVECLPEEVRGLVVNLVEDRADEIEITSQIAQKEADLAWRMAELEALKKNRADWPRRGPSAAASATPVASGRTRRWSAATAAAGPATAETRAAKRTGSPRIAMSALPGPRA
jgi:hypothetical protein